MQDLNTIMDSLTRSGDWEDAFEDAVGRYPVESPRRAARDKAESIGFEKVDDFGSDDWQTPFGTDVYRGLTGFLVLSNGLFETESVRIRYSEDITAWKETREKSLIGGYKPANLYKKKGNRLQNSADRVELDEVRLDERARDLEEAEEYVQQAFNIDLGRGEDSEAPADINLSKRF